LTQDYSCRATEWLVTAAPTSAHWALVGESCSASAGGPGQTDSGSIGSTHWARQAGGSQGSPK
jgi:hypothetical protein